MRRVKYSRKQNSLTGNTFRTSRNRISTGTGRPLRSSPNPPIVVMSPIRRSIRSRTGAMFSSRIGAKLSPGIRSLPMPWRLNVSGIMSSTMASSQDTMGRRRRRTMSSNQGFCLSPSPNAIVEAPMNVPASTMIPDPV